MSHPLGRREDTILGFLTIINKNKINMGCPSRKKFERSLVSLKSQQTIYQKKA